MQRRPVSAERRDIETGLLGRQRVLSAGGADAPHVVPSHQTLTAGLRQRNGLSNLMMRDAALMKRTCQVGSLFEISI